MKYPLRYGYAEMAEKGGKVPFSALFGPFREHDHVPFYFYLDLGQKIAKFPLLVNVRKVPFSALF